MKELGLIYCASTDDIEVNITNKTKTGMEKCIIVKF
jgi:hypothetical protein